MAVKEREQLVCRKRIKLSNQQESKEKDKIKRLWNWAIEQGADLSAIEARVTVDEAGDIHRSVYATRPIASMELMATIPSSLLLTESSSRGSPVGMALLQHFEQGNTESLQVWKQAHQNNERADGLLYMVCFMVFEQFEKLPQESFWSPYLDSLPTSFPTVPFYWTRQELDDYIGVGTNLHTLIVKRLDILGVGFTLLTEACGHLFVKKSLTWDHFLWAYTSISSRAFPLLQGCIIGGQDDPQHRDASLQQDSDLTAPQVCMWPVLDMFNHKLDQKIEWNTLTQPGHVSYIARESYSINDELFSNYGPKGNEMLLGAYGFVLDPNPNDYFKLKLQIDDNKDTLACSKRLLLTKFNIPQIHLLFELESSDCQEALISSSLMQCLRVFCMNQGEIETCSSVLEPIHSRNELSAMNALYQLLHEKWLAVSVDVPSSPQDELSKEKKRMGQVYRRSQHRILKQHLNSIQSMAQSYLCSILKCSNTELVTVFGDVFVTGKEWLPTSQPEWMQVLQNELDEDSLLTLAIVLNKRFTHSVQQEPDASIIEHFEYEIQPVLDQYKSAFPLLDTINQHNFAAAVCVLDLSQVTLSRVFLSAVLSCSPDNLDTSMYGVFME